MALQTILTNLLLAVPVLTADTPPRKTCIVPASGTNQTDDAPAIRKAFQDCAHHANVVFQPKTTYYINSVLNISGLEDVEIDIHGHLLWSTDIPYWLSASLPVGYQNQSTAFILGGNNIRLDGHGVGTLNGNGDEWYEWIAEQPNTSNYPGRPHQITFSANTDGADTFFSSNLLFRNWTVYNGDDSFSAKANSTNITLLDSQFYHGLGIAIGSIGQYNNAFETISNFRAENIYFEDTLHAFYVKTWTDDQVGFPPNGGGGGLGYAENLRLKNLRVKDARGGLVTISQCTRFSGAPGVGNCTNSQFQVRDVVIDGLRGTTKDRRVVSLQCSAVAPCTDVELRGVDVRFSGNGSMVEGYLCGNVVDNEGFNCTGPVCVGGSATGGC